MRPQKLVLLMSSLSYTGMISASQPEGSLRSTIMNFGYSSIDVVKNKIPSTPAGFILYQKLNTIDLVCESLLYIAAGGLASLSFLHGTKYGFCLALGALLPYLINALIFFYKHHSDLGDKSIYFVLPIITIIFTSSLLESQYCLSQMLFLVLATILGEILQRLYIVSRVSKKPEDLLILGKIIAILLMPVLLASGSSLYPIMDLDDLYRLLMLAAVATSIVQSACMVCNHNFTSLEAANSGDNADKKKSCQVLNPLEMSRAELGLAAPLIIAFPSILEIDSDIYSYSGNDNYLYAKSYVKRLFLSAYNRLRRSFFEPTLQEIQAEIKKNAEICLRYKVGLLSETTIDKVSQAGEASPTGSQTIEDSPFAKEINEVTQRIVASKALVLVAGELAKLVRGNNPKISSGFKNRWKNIRSQIRNADRDFDFLYLDGAIEVGNGVQTNHEALITKRDADLANIDAKLRSEEMSDISNLQKTIASFVACECIITLCSNATVVQLVPETVNEMQISINDKSVKSLELLKFSCILSEGLAGLTGLYTKLNIEQEAFADNSWASQCLSHLNNTSKNVQVLKGIKDTASAGQREHSGYIKGAFGILVSDVTDMEDNQSNDLKKNAKLMTAIDDCIMLVKEHFRDCYKYSKLSPVAVKGLRDVPDKIRHNLSRFLKPTEILPFIMALCADTTTQKPALEVIEELLKCDIPKALKLCGEL